METIPMTKREWARKVVEVMVSDEAAREMAEQLLMQVAIEKGLGNDPGIHGFVAAVAGDNRLFEALKNVTIEAYEMVMADDELQALAEFYSSEVGQRVARSQGALSKAVLLMVPIKITPLMHAIAEEYLTSTKSGFSGRNTGVLEGVLPGGMA